jgi:hypothetical protein
MRGEALNVRGAIAGGLVALLLAGGCGPDTSHLPATVPAKGTVLLDGAPIAGAQVILVPADGATNGAYGATDDQGRFSLRAFDEKEGAVPGTYKAQVSKTVMVKLEGPDLDGGDPVRYEMAVPAKYTGAETSGLRVDIPAAGKEDIKLELRSQ